MTISLVTQLKVLQTRAGSPSIRTIARLIERQARSDGMARSTIQDKLDGRSSVTLSQLLSLIEAFAEHARLIGSPLRPHEIDQEIWRERFFATKLKTPQMGNTPPPPSQEIAGEGNPWNLESLRRAGMVDVIELITQSAGTRTAAWLPRVAREMIQAQMSCDGFMETAAHEHPQEVIKTAAALAEEFPRLSIATEMDPWAVDSRDNTDTVVALLRFAARIHSPESCPVFVAGLRRAEIGDYVDGFLVSVARWHLASDIERAVENLRAAQLGRDAMQLLNHVGRKRLLQRTFEVVDHFDKLGAKEDRNTILGGMASTPQRLLKAVQEAQKGTDADEIYSVLVAGVPRGNRERHVTLLRREGFHRLASEISPDPDEPPF
jgi:hypothetical protein